MISETGVAALVEKQAVEEVITRLFVATDGRDWRTVEACLAERVIFDMSSMGAGPAVQEWPQARSWMDRETALRPFEAVHHQAGNHLTAIQGDRATASCYGIAIRFPPQSDGPQHPDVRRQLRLRAREAGRRLAHRRVPVQTEIPGGDLRGSGRRRKSDGREAIGTGPG